MRGIGGTTVTTTVSRGVETSPRLSVTVKLKVSTADAAGAVKVGWAVMALLSVTAGPPTCVHWYTRGRYALFVALPSKVTPWLISAVRSTPALATGGCWFS